MRETWDKVWSKRAVFDIDEVIACDSGYRLLKRLLGKLPSEPVNILEVGCGSGIYSLALLKEMGNPASMATLVDFSAIALDFARENAERNGVAVSLVRADAFHLPFADNTFDIVWNEGVNEHFSGDQRQLIFEEMVRVCKPGGQVAIIVPNALNLPYRLWKRIAEARQKWEYGVEMPYTISELKDRMKEAGLVPVRVGGMGTLSSAIFLGRLFLWRKHENNSEMPVAKRVKRVKRILKRTALAVDRWLGFLGAFTGAEVGVKGVKR